MAKTFRWILGACGAAMVFSAPVLAQSDSPFRSMSESESTQSAPVSTPAPNTEPVPAPAQPSAAASPFRSMAGSEPAPQPQPLEAEAPEPVETPDQSSSPFLSMEAGTAAPQAAPTAAEPEMETTPEPEPEPEPAMESAPSLGMEEPPTEPEPESAAEGDAAATEPDIPGDEDSGWSIGGFIGSIFSSTADGEADQAMDAPAIEPTTDNAAEPQPAPDAINVSSDMMQPNMRLSGGTSGENALLSRVNRPRTHIGGWEIPDKKAYPAPAENNTMEEMRRAMQMRSN